MAKKTVKKVTKGKSAVGDETKAMGICAEAINPLTKASQCRVLSWLRDKFNTYYD